jgi:hypothetical protein
MQSPPTIEKYLKKHPAAAEYRFLFACCRAAFAGTTLHYPDEIRPEVFLKIVQHHKLVPHLYPVLKSHCENMPDAVLNQFQQLVKYHNLHILKLSGELVQLSKLFAANDIQWLSIKGPALSVQLYGDIAMRQSGDLDILVRKGDLTDAVSILSQAGYEMIIPAMNMSNKQGDKYLKRYKHFLLHFLFRHKEKKLLVELHWALSHDWLTPDDITSLLWEQLETITMGNGKIPVPNVTNHLIFLYEHGSRHSWYRLAWLWDITDAIKTGMNKNIDTTKFSQELNDCFLAADILCRDLFGIGMQQSVTGKVKQLIHLSKIAIMKPEKTKSFSMTVLRFKYMLCLHSGVIGKLKSLKRYCRIPF